MEKKTSSGSGTVPGARRRLLHVQSAGFERSAKRDPCALDPLAEEESNDPWVEPKSHRRRSWLSGTRPGVGEGTGTNAAFEGTLWLVPQITALRCGARRPSGPAAAPVAASTTRVVVAGIPALPLNALALVGAELAAGALVESPPEGTMSRGGLAIVFVALELAPCDEAVTAVAGTGSVAMSVAVKLPSAPCTISSAPADADAVPGAISVTTPPSVAAVFATVAVRPAAAKIAGCVRVTTVPSTGWANVTAAASTGWTVAPADWAA